MSDEKIRLFIDTPRIFIRPNNTDWRYMRSLRNLEQYLDISVLYPHYSLGISASLEYVLGRLGLNGIDDKRYIHRMSNLDIKRQYPDIILAHGKLPYNTNGIPTIWQHAVLDPEMQQNAGRSAKEVDREYCLHSAPFEMATVVQVSTQAEAKRHALRYPSIADKFVSAPFFLPNIKPLSKEVLIEKHTNESGLSVLFVGREARRKGLQLVIEALTRLSAILRSRLTLHVVSSFADGPINVPAEINHRVYNQISHGAVMNLMSSAHIFVMPSRFESFGFTLIEAIANGCVVIGPDWEVQREILDCGNCGVLVRQNSAELSARFEELIVSSSKRQTLALAALERFDKYYSARATSKQFSDLIKRAKR